MTDKDTATTTLEAAVQVWILSSARLAGIYMTDFEALKLTQGVLDKAGLVIAHELLVWPAFH